MQDKYFATLPTDEIGDALLEKKKDYYQYLDTTGRSSLLYRMYDMVNRPVIRGGIITRTGIQGEYSNISINQIRNLIQRRVTMTTQSRPEFQPKAANTDYKSEAQTVLAKALLDYYSRVKKIERDFVTATEVAVTFGEGFVFCGWDPSSGEPYGQNPETGAPIFDGDISHGVKTTFDVIRSVEVQDNEPQDWAMTREYENKYELAAQFPTLADRICSLQNSDDPYHKTNFIERYRLQVKNDTIPVYTFYHKKTKALPQGRMVRFSDDDIIYYDGPIPYRDIPLYRIAPGEQRGYIYGYTNAFDCMPLQEAYDKLSSTVITNQAAFGVQNVVGPKGGGINVINLAGGLNYIEEDVPGSIRPLQLCNTPQEIFAYITALEQQMEILMGMSSTDRGNPEASLRSASAIALVQGTSVQFAQGLQQSYAQLLEDVGTAIVQLLQDYAQTPRIALIAGKAKKSYLKEFKGDDLNLIQRVLVDVGNPMLSTLAGRENLAEQLIQGQLIKTPQQLLEIIATGNLDSMTEGPIAELLLIKEENERLAEGMNPPVLITDDHDLHIIENGSVLASVDNRMDPKVVGPTLAHVQQHKDLKAQLMQQAMQQQVQQQAQMTVAQTPPPQLTDNNEPKPQG